MRAHVALHNLNHCTMDFADSLASTHPSAMATRLAQILLERPGLRKPEVDEALRSVLPQHYTVSHNTITRWLNRGIEMGIIERSGNTTSVRYMPTEAAKKQWIRSELARPVSTRKRVGYDRSFMEGYKPNSTYYLSAEQRRRLANACPPGSAPMSRLGARAVSLFLADLSYWSSQLEGNQYDYASTLQLLNDKITKEGASPKDRVMLLNHHDAIRHILDNLPPQDSPPDDDRQYIGVRPNDVLALHAILSQDLMPRANQCGTLRTGRIAIAQSAYIPPELPQTVHEQFEKMLTKARQIKNPWEQSLFLIVHLSRLQPFFDCNKRTARVACNIPLLKSHVMPMSWADIGHHDYTEAMMAAYEHQETSFIAAVFTEGYLRSTERFALLDREAQPDAIAAEFRSEIRRAIRAIVLDGADAPAVPATVPSDRVSEFSGYVYQQIDLMRENPVTGARFGISHDDLDAFFDREEDEANAGAWRKNSSGPSASSDSRSSLRGSRMRC